MESQEESLRLLPARHRDCSEESEP